MDKYLTSEDTKGIVLIEDAPLFKAARSDPAVFNQLYLAHVKPIYRYILCKVGDVKQSEDLTAQVFLEALESLPRYHHDGHFSAWLFSIARHKVADFYRTRHPHLPLEVTDAEIAKKNDPLSAIIQTEEAQRISGIIHQLEEADQELLRLRFVAGLDFAEIAQLIGGNMEATKKRFYRLLAHVRAQMELEND